MSSTAQPPTVPGETSVLAASMEIVTLGHDRDAALAAAERTGGVAYVLDGPDHEGLAFRTAVRASTDDLGLLEGSATVGTYLAHSRVICRRDRPTRAGQASPGLTALFGLVRRPDLTHRQADDHWRDVHAPLALEHHAAMWDYTQLSIVSTLCADDDAPPLDGIALCAFRNLEDLRNRFFNDDASREIILADIASFADTGASPRRLVATEHPFSG